MGAPVRASICLAACLWAMPGTPLAGGWCDVVFKDVAREAATILVVRVERASVDPLELSAVQVVRGAPDAPLPRLRRADVERHATKGGDRLLLAVDADGGLVREARGLGLCAVISVLPIHGDRLRAHERALYDGGRSALPLEALLDELRALGEPGRVTSGPATRTEPD
jgi:hypothetical protein